MIEDETSKVSAGRPIHPSSVSGMIVRPPSQDREAWVPRVQMLAMGRQAHCLGRQQFLIVELRSVLAQLTSLPETRAKLRMYRKPSRVRTDTSHSRDVTFSHRSLGGLPVCIYIYYIYTCVLVHGSVPPNLYNVSRTYTCIYIYTYERVYRYICKPSS